tara:strand:+ start:256 stop:411 length:156 start_codon:yes stop_codon:yes gene_type:complete
MKINRQEKIVNELLKILSQLNLERKKGIHEPYFNKKDDADAAYLKGAGVRL